MNPSITYILGGRVKLSDLSVLNLYMKKRWEIFVEKKLILLKGLKGK